MTDWTSQRQSLAQNFAHRVQDSRQIQLNKSIFINETQLIRKDIQFDTKSSKNIIAGSIHLQINNDRDRSQHLTSRRNSKHATEIPYNRQDINRPLSKKVAEIKSRIRVESSDKSSHEDFNSHLVKLKVQEMAFKFKSKIGTLLKEINISSSQLNRYTSLARIDDILNFLSQKIKERLVITEISQSNVSKIRSKQRELISEYQLQIESLKKRIQEKQALQKAQKLKIKENHNQMRQLYDKINLKEKELSTKMTELYQIKILLKESQKLILILQQKNNQLQKERNDLRQLAQNSHKNSNSNFKQLEQENQHLKGQLQEMKEMLEMVSEKQTRLIESNKNMSEEVARWRERFQEEREKVNEKETSSNPSNDSVSNERKSAKVASQQNEFTYKKTEENQYLLKIHDLENQLRRLTNENTLLTGYKEKYEKLTQPSNKKKDTNTDINLLKIQNIKEHSVDLYKIEMQAYYNKKMEELSTQWRDKLIQMVDNYAVEEEKHKEEVERLEEEKRALEKKVFVLANEKYIADCKAIELQAQIYQLTKGKGNKAVKNVQIASQELLLSSPNIKQPQQEAVTSAKASRKNTLLQSKQLPKPQPPIHAQI